MSLSVDVVDARNNILETIELQENIFAQKERGDLLHYAVVSYLHNQRQGTSSVKTRSEVRGGGAKPWRQKGTGRARMGSIRTPLRRGGGIVFGPSPRTYYKHITKKERQLAIKNALSMKLKEGNFHVVDSLQLDQPKTKQLRQLVSQLKIEGSVIFLIAGVNRNLELASRNIKNANVYYADNINTYAILYHEKIVCTKEALIELQKKCSR